METVIANSIANNIANNTITDCFSQQYSQQPKEMFMIKYIQNLGHVIIMPYFQLCMNFAAFEIARVKFAMSGINLSTLRPSFPLSLKKGGKNS